MSFPEDMFARNAPRLIRLRPRLPARAPQRRAFSSSPSPAPAPAAPLAPFVTELDRLAPSFDVRGSDIRVLKTPAEFYETLKAKIRGAERRVFLATLYIGKSEQELVSGEPIWLGRVVRWGRGRASSGEYVLSAAADAE